MASIRLDAVTKTFAGHSAVKELTLEIADGELMVLVGPSGCGKSTVLRLVAGLEQPSSGRIAIGGVDVTDSAPQQRDLAMVFQSYALYPHMTVRENLSFGLRMRGTAGATIATRIAEASRLLDIDPLLERKPSQLSGGQRQRVALGRAIVREPQAFLLDEPLSNLDPALRVDTRTELARLHRRLSATMVYVTHDQEEAMTLGTRIAVMKDGVLQQAGAPMDVFSRPVNMFVARFVGSPAMNFLHAAALRHRLAAATIAADDRHFTVLGVRPHDITIVTPDDAGADLTGTVETVERLGSTQLVHVALPTPDAESRGGSLADRDVLRVLISADTAIAQDDAVGLHVRRDRVHLFDERTGRRRA